jgi:hypothetical protein
MSRETTCPPAPWNLPEPPVIGSVKFSDRLTIVPWVVICPPGQDGGRGALGLDPVRVGHRHKGADHPDPTHLLAIP